MSRKIAYPSVDDRSVEELEAELIRLASVAIPEWNYRVQGDFGLALLRIGARLGGHIVERLQQSPQRDMAAFYAYLDLAAQWARPAEVPLAFLLSPKRQRSVFIPSGTRAAAKIDDVEIEFETTRAAQLTPARATFIAAVSSADDSLELPPPDFFALENRRQLTPDYRLATAATANGINRTLQIEPIEGLKAGDVVRIADSSAPLDPSYQIESIDENIVTLVQALGPTGGDTPIAEDTRLTKLFDFELFQTRNLQAHVLYIGHSELLNIESNSTINVEFITDELGSDSSPITGATDRWEIYSVHHDDDQARWRELTHRALPDESLANQQGVKKTTELTKSFVGATESLEINNVKSFWIRLVRSDRVEAEASLTSRIQSVKITVSYLAAENGAETDTITQAYYNSSPLSTSSRFLPFGAEPKRFDQFAIAASEIFSKPEAEVEIDIKLSNTSLANLTRLVTSDANLNIFYGLTNSQQVARITQQNNRVSRELLDSSVTSIADKSSRPMMAQRVPLSAGEANGSVDLLVVENTQDSGEAGWIKIIARGADKTRAMDWTALPTPEPDAVPDATEETQVYISHLCLSVVYENTSVIYGLAHTNDDDPKAYLCALVVDFNEHVNIETLSWQFYADALPANSSLLAVQKKETRVSATPFQDRLLVVSRLPDSLEWRYIRASGSGDTPFLTLQLNLIAFAGETPNTHTREANFAANALFTDDSESEIALYAVEKKAQESNEGGAITYENPLLSIYQIVINGDTDLTITESFTGGSPLSENAVIKTYRIDQSVYAIVFDNFNPNDQTIDVYTETKQIFSEDNFGFEFASPLSCDIATSPALLPQIIAGGPEENVMTYQVSLSFPYLLHYGFFLPTKDIDSFLSSNNISLLADSSNNRVLYDLGQATPQSNRVFQLLGQKKSNTSESLYTLATGSDGKAMAPSNILYFNEQSTDTYHITSILEARNIINIDLNDSLSQRDSFLLVNSVLYRVVDERQSDGNAYIFEVSPRPDFNLPLPTTANIIYSAAITVETAQASQETVTQVILADDSTTVAPQTTYVTVQNYIYPTEASQAGDKRLTLIDISQEAYTTYYRQPEVVQVFEARLLLEDTLDSTGNISGLAIKIEPFFSNVLTKDVENVAINNGVFEFLNSDDGYYLSHPIDLLQTLFVGDNRSIVINGRKPAAIKTARNVRQLDLVDQAFSTRGLPKLLEIDITQSAEDIETGVDLRIHQRVQIFLTSALDQAYEFIVHEIIETSSNERTARLKPAAELLANFVANPRDLGSMYFIKTDPNNTNPTPLEINSDGIVLSGPFSGQVIRLTGSASTGGGFSHTTYLFTKDNLSATNHYNPEFNRKVFTVAINNRVFTIKEVTNPLTNVTLYQSVCYGNREQTLDETVVGSTFKVYELGAPLFPLNSDIEANVNGVFDASVLDCGVNTQLLIPDLDDDRINKIEAKRETVFIDSLLQDSIYLQPSAAAANNIAAAVSEEDPVLDINFGIAPGTFPYSISYTRGSDSSKLKIPADSALIAALSSFQQPASLYLADSELTVEIAGSTIAMDNGEGIGAPQQFLIAGELFSIIGIKQKRELILASDLDAGVSSGDAYRVFSQTSAVPSVIASASKNIFEIANTPAYDFNGLSALNILADTSSSIEFNRVVIQDRVETNTRTFFVGNASDINGIISEDEGTATPDLNVDQDWETVAATEKNYQKPILSWEYFNGKSWKQLSVKDETENLTSEGKVTFVIPNNFSVTEISGNEDYWVRARLLEGDYGRPIYRVVNRTEENGQQTQEIVVDTPNRPPEIASIVATYSQNNSSFPEHVMLHNNQDYKTQTQANRSEQAQFPMWEGVANIYQDTENSRAIFVGFNQAFTLNPLSLYIDVKEQPDTIISDIAIELVAETLIENNTWQRLSLDDRSNALQQSGYCFVTVSEPPRLARLFGQELYWLRLSPKKRASSSTAADTWRPVLAGIFVNAIPSRQVRSYKQQILGSSIGAPDLALPLANAPVVPDSLELRVREQLSDEEKRAVADLRTYPELSLPGDWVRWERVDSFVGRDGHERVFKLDAQAGIIHFGNDQQGRIPPAGSDNIRAIFYQVGGGSQGNVASYSIAKIKSPVEAFEQVANPVPAVGGTDTVPLDQALSLAPSRLRQAGQLISASDIEHFVVASSPDLVRARCFKYSELEPAARDIEGWSEEALIVVFAAQRTGDRRPLAPLILRQALAKRIAENAWGALQREQIQVFNPAYFSARINITVQPKNSDDAAELDRAVRQVLEDFFHPIEGGPGAAEDGAAAGWDFGAVPHESDILRQLSGLSLLDRVTALQIISNEPGRPLHAMRPYEIVWIEPEDIAVRMDLIPGGSL